MLRAGEHRRGWMPDADHAAALSCVVADDALWVLMLSDAVGKPSLREIGTWTAEQIATALVLDETVTEHARYARAEAEHAANAAAARSRR